MNLLRGQKTAEILEIVLNSRVLSGRSKGSGSDAAPGQQGQQEAFRGQYGERRGTAAAGAGQQAGGRQEGEETKTSRQGGKIHETAAGQAEQDCQNGGHGIDPAFHRTLPDQKKGKGAAAEGIQKAGGGPARKGSRERNRRGPGCDSLQEQSGQQGGHTVNKACQCQ